MLPQDFTLETFEAAIRQQEKPVVVNFWATWSVACLMYNDDLIEAVELCGNTTIFGSIDIDLHPDLTERFSIITIPTTLIFYKEQIVKQYMGIQEPEIIKAAIDEILPKEEAPAPPAIPDY